MPEPYFMPPSIDGPVVVRRDVQIARRELTQIEAKQLARVATNTGGWEAHSSMTSGKIATHL